MPSLENAKKRLFFGLEIHSPWPSLPKIRMTKEVDRHLTIAFLGNTDYEKVETFLPHFPKPSIEVGQVGMFDACLFLPPRHPRVVAYNFVSLSLGDPLLTYQKEVKAFLEKEGYALDERDFLPHVTIGRSPFNQTDWEEAFSPLPAYYTSLHLYESLGSLNFERLWSNEVQPPFEEIEHTADIAFRIFGCSMKELHLHAQIALCFECPALLPYINHQNLKETLEEIIIDLNEMITEADQEIGTPFKAVSFHGSVQKNQLLKWEMIVDV